MQIKNYQELSTDQLYQILKVRLLVFAVEQNCPYQDIDDLDQQATHIFKQSDDGLVSVYARILAPGIFYKNDVCIGRVVTHPEHRGKNLGMAIMEKSIDYCHRHYPDASISISAQSYLTEFYKKFGFENTGDYYLDDDIPHQKMRLI
ncbi:MAG: GNAT family N-acetyltransferase [Proteobacteria bacterium]|nr:GNAT family N-acetyltransferase [Pseudomonadota bacterium]